MTKPEYLLIDIEADGLYPSQIFMITIMDLITRTRKSYVGMEEVAEGIYRMMNADMIVGHYVKGYDLPVIKRLLEVEIDPTKVVDTLELSRRYFKEMPNHKLATWGEMLGYPKLPQPIFERYTPEMKVYCERDVDLNTKMFDVCTELLLDVGVPADLPVMMDYLECLVSHST